MNDKVKLNDNVAAVVDALGIEYEIVACAPEYADTAAFCEHYGYSMADSANCIVCASSPEPRRFAACVLLANTRLDVNRVVRKRLQSKKASFASPEDTVRITGMQIGGVMPLALPTDLPLFVDAAVLERDRIIIGGGDRLSKIILSPTIFERLEHAEIVADLARPLD